MFANHLQDPARYLTSGKDDVEGHSALHALFGQQMANTRAREAAEWARGEKARREAERERKNKKGR